jgi:nitrogen regulatory protein PII
MKRIEAIIRPSKLDEVKEAPRRGGHQRYDLVATILDVVGRAASTGKIGDGKIFVTDILEAVRIRTGERGQEAV